MNLVCKRCGSDRVAQKPIKGLPCALRSYCPDCGSETGYTTPKRYLEAREERKKQKGWLQRLLDKIIR